MSFRSRIEPWFQAPRFADLEEQRIAGIVHGVTACLLVVSTCWMLASLLLPSWWFVWATAAPGVASLLGVLWLNRRGRVRLA